MSQTTKIRMTASDFLALPESNQIQELIAGAYIMSPSPIPAHQRVVFNIARLLDTIAPAGQVLIAPQDVHLDEDTVLQPDVFWIAPDGACTETKTHFVGAPDLVAEVLSPSTAINDKREKFQKYQQHGVREYWIADPTAHYIEVWQREENTFQHVGIFDATETFHSVLLNSDINVADIFPSPPSSTE